MWIVLLLNVAVGVVFSKHDECKPKSRYRELQDSFKKGLKIGTMDKSISKSKTLIKGQEKDVALDPLLIYKHYSTLSSCPWKYVTSTDRNRKPQSVMEARCIHKICVDTTAADHLSGCKDDCYCKEVYKFVKVSRRKGGKRQMKKKRFRRVWEKISVGCTCACLDRDS